MPNNTDPYRAPSDFAEGPPPQTSGKAVASLICGLLSFVTCIFTGIPAFILGIWGLSDIGKSDGRLTGKGMAITGMITGAMGSSITVIGILVALLLPAVSAARDAARRVQTMNNLKIIAMAIQGYEVDHGQFPWAAQGEEGKPPVSWRVRILPYLEQKTLYDQYHFDEAWDSEHNRTLQDLMPEVFKSVQAEAGTNRTNIAAIVGPGTMWPPEGDFHVRDIIDGTSNTIMLIESNGLDIPWMEPRDMSIDDFVKGINQPGGPQGSFRRGLIVALADGAVVTLSPETNSTDLRALATTSGGEVVSPRTDF